MGSAVTPEAWLLHLEISTLTTAPSETSGPAGLSVGDTCSRGTESATADAASTRAPTTVTTRVNSAPASTADAGTSVG